jgi:hypothetical protein
MQHDFPCNRWTKNTFCRGCLNKIFYSKIWASSKAQKRHNNDPIVKLGSFGHNSLENYTYFSSPWPCTVILVRVMGNCPSLEFILFITWNLRSTTFARSILSWITHMNSSLDCTNSDLQIWYKLLQASWCNICFFNFNSYSFISFLFLSNLDIKSFNDSHTIHLANIDLLFYTSMLRWGLFFNLLIVDWNIPPMLNFLLLYMYIIMKLIK